MTDSLNNAQDVFLAKIDQICSKFGLNNLMAQLYGVLYLSGKSLSLDDMTERLKISKGSASINIRALERYGAVKKVWVKGSRKDYYEAEANISKVIIGRIKSLAQGRLSEIEDMLDSSYSAINLVDSPNKEEKEATKVFKQRLGRLKDLHVRGKQVLDLLNSGFLTSALDSKTEK